MATEAATTERWTSTRGLRERFGVHRRTVEEWMARGEFPNAIKLGRRWRVPESDIEAFIERRRRES